MDTLESNRAIVRERISALRRVMAERGLAAWIVPSSDPHLSEYLPDRWKSRAWLCGFTGSVGTLLVTHTFAGLWVDSRYWVQAERELAGTGVEIMRLTASPSSSHLNWLVTHLGQGELVGVDGAVLALAAARQLEDGLGEKGIRLTTAEDVLESIWTDRPMRPAGPVYATRDAFTPVTRAEKLAMVRAAMGTYDCSWHLVSTLDDIAWLLNLRGSDIPYNPVFLAHLLIGQARATLFTDRHKLSDQIIDALAVDGVFIAAYEAVSYRLGTMDAQEHILLDPKRITLGLHQALPPDVTVIEAINPSTLQKSRKTEAEAQHVRRAMEQDGIALAEFFAWLENALGREPITELTVDDRLTEERARQPDFVSQSFATIAAFNANGAMPHYRATFESHAEIRGNGLLLIDSGGQYQCGTTDITRVVGIGTPSHEQRRDFTLVLRGMIALSCARFPRSTRSALLDALARAPIWAAGIDYGHGTGHGVGYFLNVHEGPQSIAPNAPVEPQTAMEAGMITSNEPGIYRAGLWGVRIENLLLSVPAETTEFGEFLAFETLTLCPIDTRCLVLDLLGPNEIDWINQYHLTVRERLSSHSMTQAARTWLEQRTAPI